MKIGSGVTKVTLVNQDYEEALVDLLFGIFWSQSTIFLQSAVK